jgi:hypothetical protein
MGPVGFEASVRIPFLGFFIFTIHVNLKIILSPLDCGVILSTSKVIRFSKDHAVFIVLSDRNSLVQTLISSSSKYHKSGVAQSF